MSKRKRMTVITGVMAILSVTIAYFFFPLTPCSSLKVTDIKEIRVFAAPPEQTVILSQEEMTKAAELLQDMTVYQPGYISNVTLGQAVKFTVIKVDETEIEILVVGNTTISVNGISYRAQYTPTKALTSFANDVLK